MSNKSTVPALTNVGIFVYFRNFLSLQIGNYWIIYNSASKQKKERFLKAPGSESCDKIGIKYCGSKEKRCSDF